MKRNQPWLYITIMVLLAGVVTLTGCGTVITKADPVTLTLWHVYGEQTDSPLNDLVDEFNKTVGAEKGIKIEVTMVSNTNSVHEAVLRAAKGEPGSGNLPDLFVSYPKTVLAMDNPEILIDFKDYFHDDELSAYIPSFLEEGEIDHRLVVFPTAKSTEIMFINKTLFDRFAEDTGATIDQVNTWEGLFALSKNYYQWTDAQTPDIPHDGKAFFVHDYHFNYFQTGVKSLGKDFFVNDSVYFGDAFSKVWEPYADAAVQGGVWLQDGYATEPLRTADAIVSVASSASVLYYENIVTYADNRSEPIEIIARPVPYFTDGQKLVIQRGAGICAVKSTPEKEKKAVAFVKWLTNPQINNRFVTSLGYMPVTTEAFDILPDYIGNLKDDKYRSLYEAYLQTQKEYTFYTAPQMTNYLELEQSFEKNVRSKLRMANTSWKNGERDVKALKSQAMMNLEVSLPQQESG